MKIKRNIFVLCIFVSILFVSACGSGSSTSTSGNESTTNENNNEQQTSSETIEFSLGHVGPADPDHPWEGYVLKFAEQIQEKTNGQVVINTYPASQLGGDREMTEALINGTLDMGLISTIAMGNFVPELQVWDLPYIFPTDNNKVDEILEGPVGDKLAEYAEEKGLIFLAYWENDWRGMSNSIRPIEGPGDLSNLRMRVVENLPSLDWFTRVGATPTPMAFSEVYTALQMGTIDGQDNGTLMTYGPGLHEVQDYYTLTKHIYAPLTFVVSKKKWEELSDDLKEQITELAFSLGSEQRDYSRQTSIQYLDAMEEFGVQISELKEEAIVDFQNSALPTYEELAPQVGQELIDMMLEYRD